MAFIYVISTNLIDIDFKYHSRDSWNFPSCMTDLESEILFECSIENDRNIEKLL